MIYFQIFPDRAIGAHDALLLTPERGCPRASGGSRCSSSALAQPRCCRRGRPRRGSLADSAAARRSHWPSWRLTLCRSTPSRRSTCGRPDAKPQADKALPRDAAMTKPVAAEHMSILWAEPSMPKNWPGCMRPLFSPGMGRCQLQVIARSSRFHCFLARAGEPPATAGFILGRLAADEAENSHTRCMRELAAQRYRAAPGRSPGRAARKAEARPFVSGGCGQQRDGAPALPKAGLCRNRATQGLL